MDVRLTSFGYCYCL